MNIFEYHLKEIHNLILTKKDILKLDKIENLDKINWAVLSNNPNALHILEQNVDKIEWMDLSANPNAIHLLQKKVKITIVLLRIIILNLKRVAYQFMKLIIIHVQKLELR